MAPGRVEDQIAGKFRQSGLWMHTDPILGSYDPSLVALSFMLALLGGYTALDFAARARAPDGRPGWWLTGAALAMGIGVWSMHFVGMQAFRLPMEVSYDIALTALSLALAVMVSGAGILAMARDVPRRHTLAVAGAVTGLGIVSMHYVGMAGMRMPALIHYDTGLVVVSVAVAIVAATLALALAFRSTGVWQRAGGALLLAVAVVGMHFIGMAAAEFETVVSMPPADGIAVSMTPSLLAFGTAFSTLTLMLLAFAAAVVERRSAAEASAAQEARYRAVVDTAVDPIVVIDGRGTVVSFNRAAETVFGYGAEEVLGGNVSMLMPEPYASRHDAYLDRYRRTGERRIIGIGRTVEGRRKDGGTFPLELSVAEWRAGGDRYYTGIMRDITERKRIEDALHRAKDAAVRADKAKSKFLAAASHDLRQPVQSLFFFAYALSERLKEHPASNVLASMSESLDALKMLLDSLLDVSRLDAGVVQPAVTEFAVAPLMERLATEYRARAAEKGLEVRAVPSSLWTRSDPVLLERLLRNLIENALRYTARGRILIGARRRGQALELQVIDSGIGIPEQHRDEIFEEFTQIGNPERNRQQGLGLGLAIVKRLASLLGHRVSLRSRPGCGSAFSVVVPAVPPRAVPRPVRSLPGRGLGRGLVVVIDDDALVLVAMRAMIEEWGYQVVAAVSADEAIETLMGIGHRPLAIVADYRLRSGRTGVEAIRDVFGVCGVRVPAVVLTGDTAPERIAEVERSGFELLHKPVAPDRLRRILDRAA